MVGVQGIFPAGTSLPGDPSSVPRGADSWPGVLRIQSPEANQDTITSVMPFGSILNMKAILVGKVENSLKRFKVFCFMFLLFENLFSCSIMFSVPPLPPSPAQLIRISQRAGGGQSFTQASQKPPKQNKKLPKSPNEPPCQPSLKENCGHIGN